MAKRGFNGAIMRAYGARDHEATVTGTELLAPNFLRVRLHSQTLLQDSNAVVAPTAYLRFWFPDIDGKDFEHQRAYTLSEADEISGDFSVDFVLHEPAGPASAWARRTEPGATVQVTPLGSTRFDLPEELPAGYLLIGDSASIPAINGILGTLPADLPVELYLEEHQDADRQIPLFAHPRTNLHRVPRQGETSLAAAIEARDWSDWYAWTAPESGSLKHLRTRLRDEFGFPKSEVHAQAYWYHGRAFGTNRSKNASAPETIAVEAPAQQESPVAPATEPVTRRGAWRSQAAGRLLAPLRPVLILTGVLQGLVTLIQLAPFVLLVELARLLLVGAESTRLWTLGIWAVVLMGVGALLASALTLWLHAVDARFERDLRQRLLGTLARLPLGWFTARGSGKIKQLVQDDTLALHYLVTHAVSDAVSAIVAPLAVLVYLFAVDWRVALVLFVPVLVYVVVMVVMVVQSGTKTAQAMRWAERMSVEAGGYLEGQPVVRVFGGAAASSFRARLDEYLGFLSSWQRPFTTQKTVMDLATRPATFLLLIMSFGTVLIVTGGMEPVTLLPFLLLGTTFGARLLGVGYGLSGLRGGLLAARRVQNALDEPALEASEATGPEPVGEPTGRVEFDDVGFSYRPGVPVIREVSLVLEPGTVTALVGPSGSGKSTLASLLARFHDVETGGIRVGGRDVRELTAEELYARVGFVFQDAQLVHGTVRENIALAVPDADAEQVEAAAVAAQIHDRIVRMPDGYDTVLGPDAALSGGERQRLTIARAILADTPVLVLDEATAFADPESEYLVQQALNRLTAGRTVLVIAHRLHTITGVDRIVVLDGGATAETGTHDELLSADGRYRRLWAAADPQEWAAALPIRTASAPKGGHPMIRTLLALLPDDRRASLVTHLCLTLVSVALRATGAVLLLPLIGALFGPDSAAAWPWLAGLAAVTATGWTVDAIIARIGVDLGFALLENAQHGVAERLTRIRLTWFTAENTTIARQTIAATGPDLVGLFVYLVTPLTAAILLPVAIGIALLPISMPLAVAALAGVPVLLGAFWVAGRIGRRADRIAADSNAALTERIVEFARTQQALRAARRVGPERSHVGAALATQHGATVRLLLMQIPGQLLFSLASQLALVLLAGTATALAVRDELGVPEAIALIVVIARYLEPFTALGELTPGIESVLGILTRMRAVLDAPVLPAGAGATEHPQAAPRIALQGITFRYAPGSAPVLDGLDVTFEPGSTTAIVGPSGSGKSTVLALLAGLHEPTAGRILIGGVDASTLSPEARRDLIGVVFQQPFLFDGTIRENILVGSPEADDSQFATAAALAQLDELAGRLPDGWDSRAGEAGTALSGGERQRVSIARALIKPAPILLVDEATSALDTENETAIVAALTADSTSRTRVVVAHRLASIRTADRVLFLEDGRIVEDGAVDTLLAAGGRFAEFWQQQDAASGWRITTDATG